MPSSKVVTGQKITPVKLHRARQLRRSMTPGEKAVWEGLRRGQLGVHFRRQQIIAGFIVDFYCDEAALVVELDGAVHDSGEQKAKDAARDKVLMQMGLRVVRFQDRDVSARLRQVLEEIRQLTRVGRVRER